MTKQQNIILWIGLALVMLYLFTNTTFRSTLFARFGGSVSGNKIPQVTLTSFVGVPSTTGNTHSNTGSKGSVQLA